MKKEVTTYLTIDEAARVMGCSKNTVRNYVQRGMLKGKRMDHGLNQRGVKKVFHVSNIDVFFRPIK